MAENLVLDDDLLDLYLDFKQGRNCNWRKVKCLLSFYKSHLTNYGQYHRIGRHMSRAMHSQLVYSGVTDNLTLVDLAKKTKLKLILSESQTSYPFVEINGHDEIESNFSGTFKNIPRNKCIDHLKALCENASNIDVYDTFLYNSRNITLLGSVCSLFGTKSKNVTFYVSGSNPKNATFQSNFNNWLLTNSSAYPHLHIMPMVVLMPPNDFHDRYMKIMSSVGTIEVLLSSGFDHLLNGTKDFTYVIRSL